MKKLILKIGIGLVCLALCVVLVFVIASKVKKAPEIDEVQDRFIYLIEESVQINEILFGAGLPVYKRDALITDRRQIYFGSGQSVYDLIMEQSQYYNVDGVRAAVEGIYSSRYLKALSETAFDGVLVGGGSYLRFYQEGSKLYQAREADSFTYQRKVYDYSTMKIVKPSDDDYVKVELEVYDVGMSHKRRVITVTFVKENGEWYLDSPTY